MTTITTPDASTVVIPVIVAPTVYSSQYRKPEKFSGIDFKKCQQKILFYLITLNLAKYLKETMPVINIDYQQSVKAIDL